MQQTIPIRETEIAKQRYIARELKQARYLGWLSMQGHWKAVIPFFVYANPSMQAEFEYGRGLAKEREIVQATDAPEKRNHIYRTDERNAG
jgi:hypothetical protein